MKLKLSQRVLLPLIVFCGAVACARAPSVKQAGSAAPSSPGTTRVDATPQGIKGTASVEGTVRDADGKPVRAALIALVSPQRTSSREVDAVETNNDGRFQFANVKPGRYAVTATAPSLVGVASNPIEVSSGTEIRQIELNMGSGGRAIHGSVTNDKGRAVAGATVRALRVGLGEGRREIFLTRPDAQGAFELLVPTAAYTVIAEAPGADAPIQRIGEKENKPLNFTVFRSFAPEDAAPPEVAEWLQKNAVALDTPEAGHGFADLQPLKSMIGNARLVCLGEATHGSREFFQLKHRMLEFLASEMGFTVFGIEASYPESLVVNEYVLTGRGDPADALSTMRFWVWDTEEVLDLIRWMRRYNEDPRHQPKLKFYGFDMQFPTLAAKFLVRYFKKVDAAFAAQIGKRLSPFENDFNFRNSILLPRDTFAAHVKTVGKIIERLETERNRYCARSSEREWAIARQHAIVLSQAAQVSPEGAMTNRDQSMAENIRSLLETEGTSTKMIAWAHNGHVSMDDFVGSKPMGSYLKKMFGSNLVSFGLVFNQGSFQAMEAPVQTGRGLVEFTVSPAPRGTLDGALARVGKPLFAIDLRRAPEGPVAEWLEARVHSRVIGALYGSDPWQGGFFAQRTRQNFDALLFVDKTSASRANVNGKRLGSGQAPKNGSPINFDLEEGNLGSVPAGWWTAPSLHGKGSYLIALDDKACFQGRRCAFIARERSPWEWGFGQLSQQVEASAYRGKRIRFRAAARAETEGFGNNAELFLQASLAGSEASVGRPIAFAGMFDEPIRSKKWRTYQLEAKIPQEADAITFGFVLAGNGRAWFDAVSLEVIDDSPTAAGNAMKR